MSLTPASIPENYLPAPDLLRGKVALVTGAGQGLGRVAALAFAEFGASVILHGRDVSKLEALYDEIVTRGFSTPAIMPLDFLKTTQAELDAFAQSIHSMFGRLDILFHGASHFVTCAPLAIQNLAAFDLHGRVNLAVPAALTNACTPLLKRAPDASVIFLTETHALEPRAFWGAYSISKGALSNLTAILADEMEGQSAVRINLCLPGPVASPMRTKSHPGEVSSQLPTMESLKRHFLYLAGSDSFPLSGSLFMCRPGTLDIP
jgi:NAD(P)-dependent dehydrogenase (short-subunit alcohol dehydrogenase family)